MYRTYMKAPFPYFGGKSSIAHVVWSALGQPAHYIEPFFGSGAVLLNRPDWSPDMTETVNDADGFVANVWRGLQFAPDEVARWCDWPVNHADMIARQTVLIRQYNYLLENLCRDDRWFDAQLAGYWIWLASCWIGGHMMSPSRKRPDISHGGQGVHGKCVRQHIYEWFRQLSARLRYVRVVCGDWTRVCGGNWQDDIGICGMFFDPPYGVEDRSDLYHKESFSVARDVAEWAVERGNRASYRIVIAGYADEHEWLCKHGWTMKRWSTNGGYSSCARRPDSQGKINRHREALFFSPYCIGGSAQRDLASIMHYEGGE